MILGCQYYIFCSITSPEIAMKLQTYLSIYVEFQIAFGVTHAAGMQYNDTVTYSCFDGFGITGATSIKCQANKVGITVF